MAATTTDTVTRAIQALGFDRISPESLTALRTSIEDWGYCGTAAKVGIPVEELRPAFTAHSQACNSLATIAAPMEQGAGYSPPM